MHKRVGVQELLILGLILFALGLFSLIASASAETSSWLSANLTVQKDGDLPTGTPVPYSISGNRDCSDHKFITRPPRILQTEVNHTACGVQSLYGLVDSNGWLEANGTRTSGKLTN